MNQQLDTELLGRIFEGFESCEIKESETTEPMKYGIVVINGKRTAFWFTEEDMLYKGDDRVYTLFVAYRIQASISGEYE